MKPVFLILLLASIVSCRKDDYTGLTINAGFACGWGSGQDSLMINRTEIRYVYYIPAKSSEPVKRASRRTSQSEWSEITDAVNYSEFMKLNYNTCNLCVDGCDEWISFHDDDIDHSIRFTKGQAIESITQLQEILVSIRSEFSK